MPFGVESSPDDYGGPRSVIRPAWSPMPFGVESSPDLCCIGAFCRRKAGGHQCLSASSPHRTAARRAHLSAALGVTNAFRRRVLTGLVSAGACHLDPSVTNAFRRRVLTGQGGTHENNLDPWCCHQCLSASSPHRTWATITRVTGTMVVTNAFRRRVLTGPSTAGDIERVLLRHQCLSASSPHRTTSSESGSSRRPSSPMPFGVESSPDKPVAGQPVGGRSGHQCLSASSPHRTALEREVYRRGVLGHQCLSASSPHRTGVCL